jgi:hypothetical protein
LYDVAGRRYKRRARNNVATINPTQKKNNENLNKKKRRRREKNFKGKTKMTQAHILGECPELLKLPLLHRPPRRHAMPFSTFPSSFSSYDRNSPVVPYKLMAI